MKLSSGREVNTPTRRWFAWYPVRVYERNTAFGSLVWLETVEWWREAYPRGAGTTRYKRIP